MRLFLLVFLGYWGSVAKLQAQAVVSPDSMVRCVVRSTKTTYKYREPMIFDVQLINQTKQPIMLVDGEMHSAVWGHFVEFKMEAYPVGKHRLGKKLELKGHPGCIRFGATSQNFVLVQPNQPHNLIYAQQERGVPMSSLGGFYNPLQPGNYEVRLIYSTSTREQIIDGFIYSLAWLDKKTKEELKTLLDEVPFVRAVSAPFRLTITR